MKTVADFKEAAERNNITSWPIHDCSICGYQCGYIIKGDEVFYDNGCDCINGPSNIQQVDWHNIANMYNLQKHPPVIAKMKTHWGF